MDRNQIKEIIFKELYQTYCQSNIKEEEKLYDDYGFDSLDIVEFTMTLEEIFGIYIYQDEEDKFDEYTVKEVIDFVVEKLKEK